MPFEEGNTLGKKGKIFDAALRRAIAQDSGELVRKAAEKLLQLAAAGEQWAVQYLADRLDGKPTQAVESHNFSYGHHVIPISERLSDPLATAAGTADIRNRTGVH